MNDTFTQEQIEEISNNSIPFPIFFGTDETLDHCNRAFCITDVGPQGILGVPEWIEFESISATGMVTTAKYVIVESYKAHESAFAQSPEDN